MISNYTVIDIATTALDNCADFLDLEDIAPPANYKDPVKIAAFQEEKRNERLQRAGLDCDLGRITAIGYLQNDTVIDIDLCKDETDERGALTFFARYCKGTRTFVGYNALAFDWPFLMRRALYLGVPDVVINCDRYRSPHIDVLEHLSMRGALTKRPLTFYCRRFGWSDLVKPLSGAEEAQAAKDGRWDELRASVEHDLIACQRLAARMGLIAVRQEEPVL